MSSYQDGMVGQPLKEQSVATLTLLDVVLYLRALDSAMSGRRISRTDPCLAFKTDMV